MKPAEIITVSIHNEIGKRSVRADYAWASRRPEAESNVENIPWRCSFRYVSGTHEVPTRLSVQSTEHSFHDKSLAPECIWGEWIYTGIIDPPHILSPPVSTLSSRTCVRACPPRLPCVPFPFVPLSPRSRRPSLYNDHPALSARPSASLYLPPSAAIAFTTISFYIVTFSACETTRAIQTPGRRFHRDATANGWKGEKRK